MLQSVGCKESDMTEQLDNSTNPVSQRICRGPYIDKRKTGVSESELEKWW